MLKQFYKGLWFEKLFSSNSQQNNEAEYVEISAAVETYFTVLNIFNPEPRF